MHWSLHLHSRIMSVTRNFNILYIHKTLCTVHALGLFKFGVDILSSEIISLYLIEAR
jgi:hypothetical protein